MGVYKIIKYTANTYLYNLKIFLLFSIAFLIAFLIPLFASVPTYNDLGSIFLRSFNIYYNFNLIDLIVIIASTLFSALFLSFAIVVINLIVKQKRTDVKINRYIIEGIEKYIGRVFVVLLIFTFVLLFLNLILYNYNYSSIIIYVIAILLTPFFLYAPSSIVIEERSIKNSVIQSSKFFFKKLNYFLVFLILGILLLSIPAFIFDFILNPVLSGYLQMVIDSIFILPFLVLLLCEFYISKFAMLK